jgi:hypothetical protein
VIIVIVCFQGFIDGENAKKRGRSKKPKLMASRKSGPRDVFFSESLQGYLAICFD